ncbi:MAG TPA: hypothetical protein VEG34_16235 [Thermoanaerobaculia bacterium]|nr:hypothetical protein [Thermoanaerobaculia bacterium]
MSTRHCFQACALLLLTAVLLLPASPAEAYGTGVNPKCNPAGDPFCDELEPPVCETCAFTGQGVRCKTVEQGGTGHNNCTTVYVGNTAVSCSPFGDFCSWIVITP